MYKFQVSVTTEQVLKAYKVAKELVVFWILVHAALAIPYFLYNEKIMSILNTYSLSTLGQSLRGFGA